MIDLRHYILIRGLDSEVDLYDARLRAIDLTPDDDAADQLLIATLMDLIARREIEAFGGTPSSVHAWEAGAAAIEQHLRELIDLPVQPVTARFVGERDLQMQMTWLRTSETVQAEAERFWREHEAEWNALFD